MLRKKSTPRSMKSPVTPAPNWADPKTIQRGPHGLDRSDIACAIEFGPEPQRSRSPCMPCPTPKISSTPHPPLQWYRAKASHRERHGKGAPICQGCTRVTPNRFKAQARHKVEITDVTVNKAHKRDKA